MATHSSILAWRIPMDRGAWQVAVHGVAKSWTQLINLHMYDICVCVCLFCKNVRSECLLHEGRAQKNN